MGLFFSFLKYFTGEIRRSVALYSKYVTKIDTTTFLSLDVTYEKWSEIAREFWGKHKCRKCAHARWDFHNRDVVKDKYEHSLTIFE